MKNAKSNQKVKKALPIVATSDFDPVRRWVCKVGAVLPILLAAAPVVIELAKLEKEREDQKRLRQQLVKDLIFGETAIHYYTPSYNNPYTEIDGMTVPTSYALSRVFSHLGIGSDDMEEIKISEPAVIDGSLLLLGGPVPNPVSRSILGIGSYSPIFKIALGKEVHLPVSFANVTSKDIGPGMRPDYQIMVKGVPQQVHSGEDYLVITSIPNIYSSEKVFDHRLFNVAGLHGGGTKAIDLLLHKEWFEKLYKNVKESSELKNAPAWQAIVKVELNKDQPKRILGFKTFRIKLDEEDFDRTQDYILQDNNQLDVFLSMVNQPISK